MADVLHEADQQGRSDAAILRVLTDTTPLGLFVADRNGTLLRSFGSAFAEAGIDTATLVGRSFFDQPTGPVPNPGRRALFGRALRSALAGESVRFDFETPRGKSYELQLHPTRDVDETVTGILGIFLDVTTRAQAEQALRERLSTDDLTGLRTLSRFLTDTQEWLEQASTRRAAVVVLRSRQLRYLEALFGTEFGESLERRIGANLAAMAPPGSIIARTASGEFALCLPGATAASATELATALCRSIGRATDGMALHVQQTAGVALFPQHGSSAERLRARASTAEHAAQVRNEAVALFDEDQESTAKSDLSITVELARALEQQEFTLAFQPIVDARTRQLVAAEALFRWVHPELGPVSPARIIPLAEQLGLAPLLADQVVDQALEAAVRWKTEGIQAAVSVNISQELFLDADLPLRLGRALRAWGLQHSDLEVELTESSLADPSNGAAEVIGRLRSDGIHVALDDFGTGYAPLSLLNHLQVDSIKIDRSFVSSIRRDDEQSSAVALSVLSIGERMQLQTTAEGVESEETAEVLVAAGCSRLQGYGIGRPAPLEEFIERWRPRG